MRELVHPADLFDREADHLNAVRFDVRDVDQPERADARDGRGDGREPAALMELTWPAYLAAFVGALAVAWVLTPLVLKLAINRQALDVPDDRKAQTSPVPYLGGVAIVAGFSAMVLAASAFNRSSRRL